MCGPHSYYNPPQPTWKSSISAPSERQQLQAAIERLEALKKIEWCPDALLVIDAAKKHLQTLPKPALKFRVTATRGERARRNDFDTRSDAVAWVTLHLWAYDSFSITEVE